MGLILCNVDIQQCEDVKPVKGFAFIIIVFIGSSQPAGLLLDERFVPVVDKELSEVSSRRSSMLLVDLIGRLYSCVVTSADNATDFNYRFYLCDPLRRSKIFNEFLRLEIIGDITRSNLSSGLAAFRKEYTSDGDRYLIVQLLQQFIMPIPKIPRLLNLVCIY
jgi:hypothetical protein